MNPRRNNQRRKNRRKRQTAWELKTAVWTVSLAATITKENCEYKFHWRE